MTDTKYTPTPWGQRLRNDHRVINPTENPLFDIAKVTGFDDHEAKANAAFIVQACNAYEANQALIAELVEALEHIVSEYTGREDLDGYKTKRSSGLIKARAALAKAKGER